MWSSAEAGATSPAGFSKGCGMWCLLLQPLQPGFPGAVGCDVCSCSKHRREAWPGGSFRGALALGKRWGGFEIPDIYVRSTHVLGVWCLNLLSGLDFRLAFPSWASRNNLSPSHLGVNLQFPIGSGVAWVVGLKKRRRIISSMLG